MRALIYKDFVMIKRQAAIALILLIALTAYQMYQGIYYVLPVSFAMLAFILPTMTFGYDEQCDFSKFAFSAPITRKEYVLSKYIPTWFIGLLSALTVSSVSKLSFHQDTGMVLVFAALSFALPVMITALMYPFIFKFGVEKGRIVMVVAYMIFFIGLSYMKEILNKGSAWLAQLQKLTLPTIAGIMFLLTLIFIGTSFGISLHIVNKKEY